MRMRMRMRKSGFGDRSGLHNHYPDPNNNNSKRKGQKKKWIKMAAHFKALSFLMFLRLGASIKIKKKIKVLQAELNHETKITEQLEEIKKYKEDNLKELEKLYVFKAQA
ncbi:hypothetical protein ACFE04_030355 [Oxalis oulophora]